MAMEQQARIGFIGLGGMGVRMAARVLDAGYPLAVYNRTPARAEPLVQRGAERATSPRDVAARCAVVITMLSDPAAVQAVLAGPDGILTGAHGDLVLVDMSTVGPADARRVVEQGAAVGLRVLNAPVMGSLAAAESGGLVILSGGPPDVATAQQPLLRTMGRAVHYVGGNEQACALKLAVNVMLLGTFQLFGEAATVATRWGVAREQLLSIMSDNPTVSPVLKARMPELYSPDLAVTFPLHLARKDLWLALSAGYATGASLPLVAAAVETFTLALRHHGDQDEARIAAFMDEIGAPHEPPFTTQP
jgi:3-hydroxyisobutyrate dehydrogenase-like beta-hydroxyacid dehydrogenase